MSRKRITRRVVATIAAGAAFAGTPLLTAAPAHAGTYCTVIPRYAPIYERDDPRSPVVNTLDAGHVVEATRLSEWAMYRVRHQLGDEILGFMKAYNLDCNRG